MAEIDNEKRLRIWIDEEDTQDGFFDFVITSKDNLYITWSYREEIEGEQKRSEQEWGDIDINVAKQIRDFFIYATKEA